MLPDSKSGPSERGVLGMGAIIPTNLAEIEVNTSCSK